MNPILKKILSDVIAVVLFMLISFAYSYTPVSQGMVLGGHDSAASIGQGQEQLDYSARHDGEVTRWTNSMFSGMPTYQISPSYGPTQLLGKISNLYGLTTTGVLCYVFILLLGFYILMRAFNFKPWLSALGAVVWAFSSYFFIIIAAGHIWKVMTLAFIPPTIAGLVLCYRGRLLWGGAVLALFTAFQVQSNHVQMTYYFLFVMFFLVVAYGVAALRNRKEAKLAAGAASGPDASVLSLTPRTWLRATGVVIVAGLLGVAANLPNLYHTYEYSKLTMRGGSELTPQPSAGGQQQGGTKGGGLDYDYITQWSYGLDETLTLLVPNFKGGGSGSVITDENYYDEPVQRLIQYAQPAQQYLEAHPVEGGALPGVNQYWGDQPMTVGPVYVGAFVCFLFLLGLFVVRGPVKWALAAATLVSLLFAWGHNVPAVTRFLIDCLPMYNKFRTVSSALVIAEFTIPLLAMFALATTLTRSGWERTRRGRVGLAVSAALTAGVCLVLWLFPGAAGNCLSGAESATMDALTRSGAFDALFVSEYTDAIAAMRHAVLSRSAGLSLLVLVLCGLVFYFSAIARRRLPAWAGCALLAVICLLDMWAVNKRYLNKDNFTDPVVQREGFAKTPADEQILKDPSPDYRVISYAAGDPFNENTTSYWHKNVGGYHAAKLQRYQDLIDRHLRPEYVAFYTAAAEAGGDLSGLNLDSLIPVLNMLNTKYFILTPQLALQNPAANGNAWFVRSVKFVDGADGEMAGLTGLDTKRAAVADARFRPQLDGSALDSGTVRLTAYEPNELHYDVSSARGGLVVFSEVYYPGWTATVDGQPAELGRADYVLRALKVPAGAHKVVLEFRPATVSTTNAIAYAALALVMLCFLGALVLVVVRRFREGGNPAGGVAQR